MQRPYDLIVYGATGYLGTIITKYLWSTAPNLRWAIAGRNEAKLHALVHSLSDEKDRTKPGVIVAAINSSDLGNLASQTRVLLNTVGPFCLYGTPVVAACIENSTAYVDSSGEHIWSQQLATEWHDRAVDQKAIIIPHCAIESSIPDILTQQLMESIPSGQAGRVSFSINHSWPGYSGGTIASILANLETYSLRQMMASGDLYASCIPNAGSHSPQPPPRLPIGHDSFLGHLTFNPSSAADQSVVMRTWSLFQRHGAPKEQYGERFSFVGYATARNRVHAWLSFIGLSVGMLSVVLFPPVRWLVKRLAPAPGSGPIVSTEDRHFVEWRASITSAEKDGTTPLAVGSMRFDMDVYRVCAVLVTEAALTSLDQLDEGKEDTLAQRLGGGILTPASLGIGYLERLQKAGLETKITVR